MARKNKFGIDAPEVKSDAPRIRSVGPMGAAVREAAEDFQASTEAKVEARRKNAEDAREFRTAQDEGRVLANVSLTDISTDALPRDRMDLASIASSVEMEELKASIRERGQKEPVELFRDEAGALQLKKGWRRLTALRQLFAETGDDAYSKIVARIESGESGRLDRYIDMVEENVVREDLSFAEMAQVALTAAADPNVPENDPDALVNRLYASLHKMKRSYVRSFVFLLNELGDSLKFPKSVSRNIGSQVARKLQKEGGAGELRAALEQCTDALLQHTALLEFVGELKATEKPRKRTLTRASEKFEFRVGEMKVTARKGECRIVSGADFASLPKD
ncbi:MAG: ParB/RepB/Spo0J family partition protein, partial [Boseongicola sp.]